MIIEPQNNIITWTIKFKRLKIISYNISVDAHFIEHIITISIVENGLKYLPKQNLFWLACKLLNLTLRNPGVQ